MPSPTSASRAQNIKGQLEKVKNGGGNKVTERSASFHGKGLVVNQANLLRRPKTDPDLLVGMRNKSNGGIFSSPQSENIPKLTKLLLNVTVQRSLGPIHVVMSPDSTVGDLITMVVKQYSKEGRRPSLSTTNASDFNLHYSQFSLESKSSTPMFSVNLHRRLVHGDFRGSGAVASSNPPPISRGLDKEEKLIQLGSRNFFLCPKIKNDDVGFAPFLTASSSNPCSNQAERYY
ncbi:hypothetical protein C5167_033789 [Papaver somniferum]|uniref:DUF7054 domain-containing protein n=1 Tax=Papaver somniferum TaxID=3469 RepID=A0A4Y7KCR9_PAPSO|nr:hypothetical protein C5167_033789 [Papaver somniferum]